MVPGVQVVDIGSESYNHRTRDYVYGQRDGQIDRRVHRGRCNLTFGRIS